MKKNNGWGKKSSNNNMWKDNNNDWDCPECDFIPDDVDICDFVPEVEECDLQVICDNAAGQETPGQGSEQEQSTKDVKLGETSIENIPDVRTDTYCCTNGDCHQQCADKTCFSGSRKKKFDICGCIEITESQCGELCNGSEKLGDKTAKCTTNKKILTLDNKAEDGSGNPCFNGNGGGITTTTKPTNAIPEFKP